MSGHSQLSHIGRRDPHQLNVIIQIAQRWSTAEVLCSFVEVSIVICVCTLQWLINYVKYVPVLQKPPTLTPWWLFLTTAYMQKLISSHIASL